MKLGITGLPNVGKSTLFNALTENEVDAQNYPFCTIDPNIGVVEVPDRRLEKLSEWVEAEKTTPATVEFLDVAGLVENAHEGEGLGNQFLSQIRDVDAICHVIRVFEDENVSHVEGTIDPRRDTEIVNLEFAMSDLEVIRRRMDTIERKANMGDKEARQEYDLLERIHDRLDQGELPDPSDYDEEQRKLLSSFQLLTLKPVLYVLNVDEDTLREPESSESLHQISEYIQQKTPHEYVVLCARLEQELVGLEPDEKEMFLREYGLEKPGLDRLIRAGYELLGLITFFTYNENELRAWTLEKGGTAGEAAGRVHSDFQEQFIRAETINFETFKEYRSWKKARGAGELRSEGKDYVVRDGDILLFRTGA